jgi:hypothetical protein
MNEYPKECPKCKGYMHRCPPYVEAVCDKMGKQVTPSSGCYAQANRALPGQPESHTHPVWDWWICLSCDLVEAF